METKRTKKRPELKTVWRGIKKQSSHRSIVSNLNVEDMKNDIIGMEMSILKQLEDAQRNKEKQKLKEYIEMFLPQLCRYIYDSDNFEISMGKLKVNAN